MVIDGWRYGGCSYPVIRYAKIRTLADCTLARGRVFTGARREEEMTCSIYVWATATLRSVVVFDFISWSCSCKCARSIYIHSPHIVSDMWRWSADTSINADRPSGTRTPRGSYVSPYAWTAPGDCKSESDASTHAGTPCNSEFPAPSHAQTIPPLATS